MDKLWRKLAKNTPPKVHVWQHIALDLERFQGLKNHNEAKIEVSHQVGWQTALRFRALAGDIERKIKAASRFQANLEDPAMKARQIEIQQQRARKLGAKAEAKKSMKAQEHKRMKQEHIHAMLDLPEIDASFPSMLELTIIDRQAAKQAAANGDTDC